MGIKRAVLTLALSLFIGVFIVSSSVFAIERRTLDRKVRKIAKAKKVAKKLKKGKEAIQNKESMKRTVENKLPAAEHGSW